MISKYILNADHKESGELKSGGWNRNVYSWLVENDKIPIYLIKYEELLSNSVSVVSKLNDKLKLGISKMNIEIGCKEASFNKMRKLEHFELMNEVHGMFYSPQRKKSYLKMGVQFINKGASGNYINLLNKSQIEVAKKAFNQGMILTGYK